MNQWLLLLSHLLLVSLIVLGIFYFSVPVAMTTVMKVWSNGKFEPVSRMLSLADSAAACTFS